MKRHQTLITRSILVSELSLIVQLFQIIYNLQYLILKFVYIADKVTLFHETSEKQLPQTDVVLGKLNLEVPEDNIKTQ